MRTQLCSKWRIVCLELIALNITLTWAIVFDEVNTLHVWITISSLAVKDKSNHKGLLSRQVELNWFNAPLEDANDYIGLYLDGRPEDSALPVSVHRLNGQTSGQIITDFYLPQLDLHNELPVDQGLDTLDTTLLPSSNPSQQNWVRSNGSAERLDDGESLNRSRFPRRLTELKSECIGYCIAYHSRNKILAQNCLQTNPNWMRESFKYIGARSLPSLMLPGSHNSATYPKQLDRTVLSMINKYQMNQDENIFNQLVYGVRYLDLRVGYSKVKQRTERFWIYHDIFRTEVPVNEVFEQVRRFLDLTSHEIIVMDFHRFTVGFQNEDAVVQKERHAALIDMIFRDLGQYIVPSYLGQHAPLSEYVGIGKRLLIGYASKASIVGNQPDQQFLSMLNSNSNKVLVRDIDAPKQDQGDLNRFLENNQTGSSEQTDRRIGTRIFNKLKSFKLVSNSFSKRQESKHPSLRLTHSNEDSHERASSETSSVSRAALFFLPIRHLWPNKDTIEGLAKYMNDTTCRKYFGELRSMMVELTPTVFGVLADKYDGNRNLAQLVNRQVTDWIRTRWLHCINIVSSDFFLGNDLIRLSIYANKLRVLRRDVKLGDYIQCKSFRHIEHLLDKSRIPIQISYQQADTDDIRADDKSNDGDVISHVSSDGNQIFLKPLTSGQDAQTAQRNKRDSFVDNVSDGFTSFISSFKRLFNI